MRMSGPPPVPKRGIRILGYMVQELLPWLKANRVIAGAGLTSSQTHNGIVINYKKSPWQLSKKGGLSFERNVGWIYGMTYDALDLGVEHPLVLATATHTATDDATTYILIDLDYAWYDDVIFGWLPSDNSILSLDAAAIRLTTTTPPTSTESPVDPFTSITVVLGSVTAADGEITDVYNAFDTHFWDTVSGRLKYSPPDPP
jgi:hypothetical protein